MLVNNANERLVWPQNGRSGFKTVHSLARVKYQTGHLLRTEGTVIQRSLLCRFANSIRQPDFTFSVLILASEMICDGQAPAGCDTRAIGTRNADGDRP